MSKNNILIIPLDDRPCTYDFPIKLSKIAGYETIIPDKNILGNIFKVGNREEVYKIIKENFQSCIGLIIAFDTLLYGGLIPSRRNYDSFEKIKSFLSIIKEIKKIDKDFKIYANTTIMRMSNNNYNEEEKEYWSEYGEKIYKYSYSLHKKGIINENNYENFDINSDDIPKEIIKDYFQGRLKNFLINKEILNMAINKEIDFLSISCDDSGKYGFNVLEKKLLNKYSKEYKNIVIYPGADESISVLTARLINEKNKFKPKFFPLFNEKTAKDKTITMYEGVVVSNTLKNQIKVLGGKLVKDINKSDIVLYFHLLDRNQEDQYLNSIYKKETYSASDEFIKDEIDNIKNIMRKNNLVILDIAYANGADQKFTENLLDNFNPLDFLSYSAWNTAGNSIGTAISHSSISKCCNKNNLINSEFIIERFLDDYLYEGKLRLEFVRKYNYPLNDIQLEELRKAFENEVIKFIKKIKGYDIKIKNIEFPWKRPFEIDIQISLNKN